MAFGLDPVLKNLIKLYNFDRLSLLTFKKSEVTSILTSPTSNILIISSVDSLIELDIYVVEFKSEFCAFINVVYIAL